MHLVKMSLFDNFDIKNLAKLLKSPDPNRSRSDDGGGGDNNESGGSSDEDAEDEIQRNSGKAMRVLGPSDIGNAKRKEGSATKTEDETRDQQKPTSSVAAAAQNSASSSTSQARPQESNNKSKIWSEAELKAKGGDQPSEDVGPDVSLDPRQVPAYEMYFSQSVTPEDVYLQMGHKTPATSSCESLIVKISLPGEDHCSMQLELKEQRVELRSPAYILSLPTPHPIDPRAGNAKWNKETETLVLTLKLDRDLDMLNF